MGADYYAITVIGVCYSEECSESAKIRVRKKAFDHSYEDDGNNEYHPKDGRKLWLDDTEEVDADYPAFIIDGDNEYGEEDAEEGQIIVKIPSDIDFTYDTDQTNSYIGWVASTGSSNGGEDVKFLEIPSVENIKKKLKNLLEPHGLWDEGKFGIYTILCCSY